MSEKTKKHTSIRIYEDDKMLLESIFGSVQAGLDAFIEIAKSMQKRENDSGKAQATGEKITK